LGSEAKASRGLKPALHGLFAAKIRKPFHLSDLVQLLRDVLAAKQEAGA
jgi:hypothetical protein